MKKSEVTQELFARWSFERDREVGLVSGTWAGLDRQSREDYIDEARFYVSDPNSVDIGWPLDILRRLEEEDDVEDPEEP